MKKFAIIFLLALILAAPFQAQAFSYLDVLRYGKKFFIQDPWSSQKKPVVNKIKKETAPVFNAQETENRYKKLGEAYRNNDISVILSETKTFSFSEEEINYFAQKEYGSSSTAIVNNLKVDFRPGLVNLSGYSNLKSFKGYFTVDLEAVKEDDGFHLRSSEASLGRVRVPSFLLNGILDKETKNLRAFLSSSKDSQLSEIVVSNDSIELKYRP